MGEAEEERGTGSSAGDHSHLWPLLSELVPHHSGSKAKCRALVQGTPDFIPEHKSEERSQGQVPWSLGLSFTVNLQPNIQ